MTMKIPSLDFYLKKTIFSSILILAMIFGVFANPKNTPKNVVALSKSVAEMWLLAGGKLAGTTDDGLELSELEDVVSVGTLTTSSLEAIISLNPDFVILTRDIPIHKKFYGNLRDFGIKTYIADIKKFSDYENAMSDFTDLTGRKDLYEKNVENVKKRINEIIRGQDSKNLSYLFLRVSSVKNKVLKDHFGNEILENLRLRSIVKDNSALDEIGIEAILSADPDFIFVVQQGNQKNAEAAFYKSFESNPAWKGLKAVKNGRVFVLPKELFNYKPNAQWAEAYEIVAKLLK